MIFRAHIRNKLVKQKDRVLEFGPLTRPIILKNENSNVFFADIRSTDEIKKLYTSNEYLKSTGLKVDVDSIVGIDYVVKDSYKNTFDKVDKFDAVILSHVIEHMPDILGFFKDISHVISNKGKLIIIYPDARYCFDRFRNGTSFVDAYEVHKNPKSSSNRVLDFVYNVIDNNDPKKFWGDKEQVSLLPKNNFNDAIHAYRQAQDDILPDDTHFWPFADYQLIKFFYDADRAGMLDFEIDEFYPTQHDTQECMVVLKPKTSKNVSREKYVKALKLCDPLTRMVNDQVIIANLEEKLLKAKSEMEAIQKNLSESTNELKSVYSSKRWVYASKFASIKGRLSK